MKRVSKKTGAAYTADGKMHGGIYKRGTVWWVKYQHAGKTVCESSGSTRREDAVALREAKRTQSRRGELVPDARRVTVGDLLNMLEVAGRAKGNRTRPWLTRLCGELGVTVTEVDGAPVYGGGGPAVEITTDRVTAYVAARLSAGAARATVNQELAALRRAFNVAVKAGRLAGKPVIETPDPKNERQGFFEDAVFRRVMDALPECLRPVFEFARATGWRVRSEVLPLRWQENVDWKAGVVRLEPGTTKNGDGREFPFAALPRLQALLGRRRTAAGAAASPWVFSRDDGRRITYDWAIKRWRSACRRAGHAGLIPHDLRRTAVRNLEHAGVSQSVAMSLTGHKTAAIYKRYAIVDSTAQREGVAKLARLEPTAT